MEKKIQKPVGSVRSNQVLGREFCRGVRNRNGFRGRRWAEAVEEGTGME